MFRVARSSEPTPTTCTSSTALAGQKTSAWCPKSTSPSVFLTSWRRSFISRQPSGLGRQHRAHYRPQNHHLVADGAVSQDMCLGPLLGPETLHATCTGRLILNRSTVVRKWATVYPPQFPYGVPPRIR